MPGPCQRRALRHAVGLATLVLLSTGFALFFAGRLALSADDNARAAEGFKLKQGDHICLIGNTLADRMQHDGWLETLLQTRFASLRLVLRDLGFSGDELTVRLRSAMFGSPDEWLTKEKADVVFAFFGYNESFAGRAGLAKFKKDLEDFVKHTLAQKYNGHAAPRLVLFSPIAHENLHDRNLPDGAANNQRIELYTAAMAEVARANHVPFVDLYKATREFYAKEPGPLTINGIHLNENGNYLVARAIDRALFASEPELTQDKQSFDKLRQSVLDKNSYWFERYRTLDGYNVFGGRADLNYGGITNRVVMQREMEVLDVMAAKRDKRIWAVAQGGELQVDDSDTPPFIPVETNKPGAGPHGTHLFLDGTEAIEKMTLAKGLKVNLFASEKEFPELAKPVQMAFDTKGRLWVAVWPSYPHWKPKEERNDKLLVFEDTTGGGKADKCTVFADHLHCPTGFDFYNGGVLVAQAPGLLFLKDTTGNGKADMRVRVLDGLDSADTHHTSNSFTLDPGGALYFQEGTFHRSQVETPYGPPQRLADAGVFRYEPRTQKFDVYVTYPFANPHGHVFNYWGQDIVVDGTGANPYDAALFSGHLEFPQKHPHPPQVYQQWTRPCPGMEILSSRHFPADMQGNLLVANVIGYQGILQYKIRDKGASLAGTEAERLLFSSDPNFRPSDIKVAPDGSIYFLDWQNPIIGHMQHHLRDPNRDRTHGRIYRITYEGRPLDTPVAIAGAPIEKLLSLLTEPEDRVRYRTRIELGGRDSDQVIAAANKWLAGLDKSEPGYEHNVLEGLWVHQAHNVVDVDLLNRVLHARDFHARAAATRVLCYWRERVPDALQMLKELAADTSPRVRLEAVRAASFFTTPDALEVALISEEHPSDEYVDFVRAETMKALNPYVKKAIAAGATIRFTTPAGARFFLKSVSTDDLLKMKPSAAVYHELLARKGVRDESRAEAVSGLARFEHTTPLAILLGAIRGQDEKNRQQQEESVTFDLVRLLTNHSAPVLAGIRGDLQNLALQGKTPVTRELAYVALIAADGTVDKAWSLGNRSAASLLDLVSAMPLIRDPALRASLYPRIEPLLHGLPADLASRVPATKTISGRYVRVELPGRRKTLSLAEVEVFSDGRNIALAGKATQKNTANGGSADKAIDGNASGKFGDGGMTHSQEATDSPWWQVDLGGEAPIDSIVIYNRNEGDLGKRLNNFTLKVLNQNHDVVFSKTKLAAPDQKAVYEVGGQSLERAIRRAAMLALTSVRGREADAFKALARFVSDAGERSAAIAAMQRIPVAFWPKEEATPVLNVILDYVRTVPVKERTSPSTLDAIQLADLLASLLPLQEAKAARHELGELGVRVIHIATVPEQMLYNKERIAVKAGKPFEVIFENNDLMPHNFVITQPGALEEIGTQAEATATQPGAMERHYVPLSNKILVASRLLQPRATQKLSVTAPARAGVYPYVCTYPGHWRRMYGALYVVDDLDEYLADAEGYVARHPLPIADELLKFNRPRKEWKYEELASAVEQLDHGRSLSTAKQIFQVANCVACHKVNGIGTDMGPDLTKLDAKLKPVDILKDILEPSFRINEKYYTYIIETNGGKLVTGLILEETPDSIKVIENPLVKSQPVVIKKADIAEKKKVDTSIMPKGLLDKLSREEILDLVAYVAARGDEHHKYFQGGHDHGHGH